MRHVGHEQTFAYTRITCKDINILRLNAIGPTTDFPQVAGWYASIAEF